MNKICVSRISNRFVRFPTRLLSLVHNSFIPDIFILSYLIFRVICVKHQPVPVVVTTMLTSYPSLTVTAHDRAGPGTLTFWIPRALFPLRVWPVDWSWDRCCHWHLYCCLTKKHFPESYECILLHWNQKLLNNQERDKVSYPVFSCKRYKNKRTIVPKKY